MEENAFQLFPKELWEMILDRVEDSKDVLRVFKVYPELDISFESKKRFWLIGQVIHILMNRFALKEKQILKCRLVCKQWKMRVDCALETQCALQAYHPELDKEEKDYWAGLDRWTMIDFLETSNPDKRIPECFPKKFFGRVAFKSDFTKVGKFLRRMRYCPPTQNPFVGRALTIVISNDKYNTGKEKPQEEFWRDCFLALERYGRHLQHLSLCIDDLEDIEEGFKVNPPLGIWKTFLGMLSYLPNLKSLQLDRYLMDKLGVDEPIDSNLPSLPYLESLSILSCNLPGELIHSILTTVGGQLHKLEVAVKYWNVGMESLFKNLTELELNFDGFGVIVPIPHWGTVSVLISSIFAPNLVKLRVEACENTEIVIESDVFKWLRRFPTLKYLNIGDCWINFKLREENLGKGPIEKFPLEYLSIRDSGKLSFNFLRSFPSLRELKMFINPEPLVTDLSIPSSQIKLREELQTLKIYDSNIWEHLPKLMNVVLYESNLDSEYEHDRTYRFCRDHYEKVKAGRKEKESEFNRLRFCIEKELGICDSEGDTDSSNDSSDDWDEAFCFGWF